MKLFGIIILVVAVTGEKRVRRFSSESNTSMDQYLQNYVFQIPGVNFGAIFGDVKQILNYGCWCHLKTDEGIQTGNGAPVDDFDAACRSWHSCMDCLDYDFGCITETGYPIQYEPSAPIGGRVQCDNPINGDCATNACKCDEQLAFTIASLWGQQDPQFFINDSEESFDYVNKCVAAPGTGGSGGAFGTGGSGGVSGTEIDNSGNSGTSCGSDELSFQCCGTYPERFVFSNQGGCRGCCGAKTFNTDKQQCCNNVFLQGIGNEC